MGSICNLAPMWSDQPFWSFVVCAFKTEIGEKPKEPMKNFLCMPFFQGTNYYSLPDQNAQTIGYTGV